MNNLHYRITPIDPVISRDARTFGAGSPMHVLSWPSQTLIAGAVRSVLWKISSNQNERTRLELIKQVKISGSFPVVNKIIYFPRALDIIQSIDKDKLKHIWQIRPMKAFPDNSGADMPLEGLLPAEPDSQDDFKPEKLDAFWSMDLMTQWLLDGKNNNFTLDENKTLASPSLDERVHVYINPESGTSLDGKLFSTTGLDFTQFNKANNTFSQGQMSINITNSESESMPEESRDKKLCMSIDDLLAELPEKFIAPVGGERRLAEFSRYDDDHTLWKYPANSDLKFSRGENNKLRLILATPAIFKQGWLPDFINRVSLTGTLPGTEAKVKLISAVTDRWLPVSGWGYERGREGPKPMRRAVPSGSVYFLEVIEGSINIKDIWLKSICQDKQDINDGFGLVLAGAGQW